MSELIREIPEYLRPCEKAQRCGIDALDDAELLAVILRTGRRGEGALTLSRKLIGLAGGTAGGLMKMTEEELERIPGIGPVKAMQIRAVIALSARLSAPLVKPGIRLTSPDAAADCFMQRLCACEQETVLCAFLDTRGGLIRAEEMSRGTVSSSQVPVREILVKALKCGAVSMILFHNHPSGDPEPSVQDAEATKTLKSAAELSGLKLLDHIIIGDHRYVSLHERGILL